MYKLYLLAVLAVLPACLALPPPRMAKFGDDIDWTAINAKLPTGSTKVDRARRRNMFRQFDPNGNGVLSLAEVDRAIRDVLWIEEIFDAKPAIMRAFQIAKNSKPSKRGEVGDDYIELREFKYFLLSLRQYFEYWVAFMRVDRDGDRRISLDEFLAARRTMEVWVGRLKDVDAEFRRIDTNRGSFILFDEFCRWAIKMNLDLEDDDDDVAQ